MDVYEDEHNITLKIEVPGVDEKDIAKQTKVNVDGEKTLEAKASSKVA